jgi:pSer/pThr/pTyr-binding forkhead associated (FHA) protein
MEVAQLVGAGRSWQLEAGRSYRVGRDPSCEICIPHDEVSRVHAEVFLDPAGGWTIRDGRSLNGLYVAGRRVSDAPLEGPTVVTLSPSPHAPSLRVHRRTDATLPTHRPPTQVTAGAPLVVGGVLAGESPGAGAAPVTIGRAPDNSVVVDDLLVSRHHLRATPVREGFRIEDLGSRNGSYVNGTPITSCTLRPGDRLTVGHLEFRIEGGALKMTPTRTRVSFEAKNLRVRLPVGKQLLDDVSFALPEASLLGVIGPSGAGKSTLLGGADGGSQGHLRRRALRRAGPLRQLRGAAPPDRRGAAGGRRPPPTHGAPGPELRGPVALPPPTWSGRPGPPASPRSSRS